MRSLIFLPARAAALALLIASPQFVPAQESPGAVERTRLFSSAGTALAGPAALSPDGKWLLLPIMESPSKAHLSVTRVGSEETQQLTSSGSWDSNPVWSPSGDRIYFVSNRTAPAGDQHYHLMVLGFDASTGKAAGEPRMLVPDEVSGTARVSPDGKMVAFVDGKDRRLLKVAPAAGGASRVVTRMPVRSGNIAWGGDGEQLYFITNVALQSHRVLHRVSVDGGEIEAVSSELPPRGQLLIGPGAETFIAVQSGDGRRDNVFNLYDRRGTLLRTFTVNRNTRPTQITADGRALVAVESDVVAPTRIMAVDDGTHRNVTEPVAYDWVMRWSEDGKTLYTWTEQDGAPVLAAVPVDGGAPRTFPETEAWGAEGANSRYVFQASKRDGAKPRSLVAIDLRDGSRHTVSDSLPGHNMLFPYGPGGTWAAHEELYFFERRGDRLHVNAWRAPGDVRTLRTLPVTLLGRSNVAVHGDRVVWQQERGDSVDLMIAEGSDAPRRLLAIPAMPGTNEISFSHDGKLLALHYSRGPGSPDLMAFVDPSGGAPPRIVDTGLSYWYWPRWLPDNSGVLVVGGGAGAEAHIVRIPVAEGPKAVHLTRGDPASKWGFELSPDGRYIAYPAEIWRGSSVWRISLGDGGR